MRPRTEARAGFALIEVLAALVVTAAFVALVVPFAIHLLARWGTGEPEIESADAWMQAIERLSDDVAESVPILLAGNGGYTVGFRAAPESMKLIRPSLQKAAGASLEVVTYSIISKPGADLLVRRARPFVAETFDVEQAPESESVILDGPFRLRFSAVDANGKTNEDGWQDRKTMPLRVELWVRGLPRGRVPPAPIVLPLAANVLAAGSTPPMQEKAE